MEPFEPTTKKVLHPLVATAAVAVIVVSALGAITLITSQVGAHRGDDAPAAVAASDPYTNPTATPPAAPTPTTPLASPVEKTISPNPAHPPPPKEPTPRTPAAGAE